MPKRPDVTRLHDRVAAICLALPEAVRTPSGQHADFRVRKKVFAYFLNDHHGDGIVSVCAKAPPGENTLRASCDPERFYLPAYIAPRGWVGLRLDVRALSWDEVAALVEESYRLVAPKRLVAALEGARPQAPSASRHTEKKEPLKTRRR
jgi:predicted DNA-binding protein (MmcQ/YjbR family)